MKNSLFLVFFGLLGGNGVTFGGKGLGDWM